eukprot:604377-Amphidinium_carterae.1
MSRTVASATSGSLSVTNCRPTTPGQALRTRSQARSTRSRSTDTSTRVGLNLGPLVGGSPPP